MSAAAPSQAQAGIALLARAASLAGRPGIVVVEEDLNALEDLVGSRTGSHRILQNLETDGRLRSVRRGIYVLVSQTGNVEADLLDLVAAVTPPPYLITAGRALQFHDLSDQHFRLVLVATARKLRAWGWRGDRIKYARVAPKRLRGSTTRSRRTAARIAPPARAIVDSLEQPAWGVSLSQVVEALDLALRRYDDFGAVLAVEAADAANHALARRLGFLVSRLADRAEARPFLPLRGSSKAITPLQAGAPQTGAIDRTWHVRENVPMDRLLGHREVM
jgi:predicted transcriptional regulator of viral defense system